MSLFNHLICLALALGISITTANAQKKTKATKQALPAHLAALDTLQPVSPEVFSYALGLVQADVQWQTFKQRNPTATDAIERMSFGQSFVLPFQHPDSIEQLRAYSAGISIAKMTDAMLVNNKLYRLSLTDSTNFFDTAAGQAGFVEALQGKARYSLDSAKAITLAQAPYYEAVKAANAAKMMADNLKEKPYLHVSSMGWQYNIIQDVDSGTVPNLSSRVKVHYEGRLFDGRVFDSSYERGTPAEFKIQDVIKGWQEVLQEMPTGAIWEVYIPQEKAYGAQGTQDHFNRETGELIKEGIPPYAPLIFKIHLLEILP